MKFPPPLRLTIPAILLLLGVLLGTLSFWHEWHNDTDQIEREMQDRAAVLGNQVSSLAQFYLNRGDANLAALHMSLLGATAHLEHALLCDDRNIIQFSTRLQVKGQPVGQALPGYLAGVIHSARDARAARFVYPPGRDQLVAAFPFLLPPGPGQLDSLRYGVFYAQYDLATPKRIAHAAVVERTLAMGALLAIFYLLAWLLLYQVLDKRVNRLLEATQALSSGYPTPLPPLEGNDELAVIARAIENMAEAIQARSKELEETNLALKSEVRERARAQAELQCTEDTYRHAIAAADAVPYQLDYTKETYTFMGEGIAALTGYTAEELTPALMHRIVLESHMRGAAHGLSEQEAIQRARSGEITHWKNDSLVRTKSGELRWLADSSVEVLGGDGRPTSSIGILQDITERKRAEEQRLALERKLQDAQRYESLGVLAGGIAHDFNNLLTAIMGNAGLARLDLPPAHPVSQNLGNIERASLQAADLCQQMLAYSGKGRFKIEPLNLNAFIHEITQLLRVSLEKGVSLEFDLPPALPWIEADTSQIRQVLMNLVINASEAMGGKQGSIRMHTGIRHLDERFGAEQCNGAELEEGDYVFVEVADNGCGMSAETQARIFNPFFTTKFTGRGLGLAAVLGIVKGHKGAIHLQSQPGVGTTFTVFLPYARVQPEQSVERSETDQLWRGQGKLLLVDDEDGVREITHQMLRTIGFEVVQASDGVAGVETFARHAGDLAGVILDLTMPRMGGDEAHRRIRAIRPDVPVLLISGYSEVEALDRFAANGAQVAFLQKPFQTGDLREALRKIFAAQISA